MASRGAQGGKRSLREWSAVDGDSRQAFWKGAHKGVPRQLEILQGVPAEGRALWLFCIGPRESEDRILTPTPNPGLP